MKVKFYNPQYDEETLLLKFNNRDCLAFGQIYEQCFNEMIFFTSKLFKGSNVDAADIVQDVFISIWQADHLVFENSRHIKAYAYASIRNKFKNYLTKQVSVERYNAIIINDEDTYITEIIETEIYSFLQQCMKMLPEDCADIIRFHLEGWNIKEIAEKLNISERSVYNKKKESIIILKKLPKINLYLLSIIN